MDLSSVALLPAPLHPIHATAASFVEELRAWEAELPWDAPVPRELQGRVRVRSRELGFFGKTQPQAFGGSPAGPLEMAMLQETFAAANLRLTSFIFGPSPGMLAGATGELRRQYLEPLMAGEKTGAFGFTEPDDAPRRTWAKLEGEHLVVNGEKSYVTGGDGADFVSCLVGSVEEAGRRLGSAVVVIDREQPGVSIERIFRTLEGGTHAHMRFHNVKVPRWRVVGRVGAGLPKAMGQIGATRVTLSAFCVGRAVWVLRFISERLNRPRAKGPLADAEGVRLRVGDMIVDLLAARSLLYRTAQALEAGEVARLEVSALKLQATEMLGRVVDQGVQLCGGEALREGHPLERLYRSARSFRFTEGASDLLRLQLAQGLLQGSSKL